MADFPSTLLDWYAQHGRTLPWRGSRDASFDSPQRAYAIWVSEIMLQQTRVEAVIPYYARWMERFPSLADLAAASEQEVLSVWEGLGYYSRARHLHQAARIVMEEHAGELPRDPAALRKLPGIGRYTAGAIASLAFGLDVATLDGNIRRVLARLFDVSEPADGPAGERRLWSLAEQYLPKGRAGDYNQALMDLGAMICLPRNPTCRLCPLAGECLARQRGTQAERPVLKPRPAVPHYTVTAAVLWQGGRVLLAQRPSKGLLGGLWEFPGGKTEPGETLAACLVREIREELAVSIRVGQALGVYEHAYTHFQITLHAFACELLEGQPKPIEAAALAWVRPEELKDYPMGKVDRQIARKIAASARV